MALFTNIQEVRKRSKMSAFGHAMLFNTGGLPSAAIQYTAAISDVSLCHCSISPDMMSDCLTLTILSLCVPHTHMKRPRR